ncbi:MAG: Dabb family protein [Actinomycetota bacterium]
MRANPPEVTMFHHVAMFRFAEGTTAEQIDAVDAALAELPAVIDVLVGYRFGRDAGITDNAWDYVVVADLAGPEDFPVYRDHPQHRAVVEDVMKPLVVEASRIQFES